MPSLTIHIFVKMWVHGCTFIMYMELSASKIFPCSQDRISHEISAYYGVQKGKVWLLSASASKIC